MLPSTSETVFRNVGMSKLEIALSFSFGDHILGVRHLIRTSEARLEACIPALTYRRRLLSRQRSKRSFSIPRGSVELSSPRKLKSVSSIIPNKVINLWSKPLTRIENPLSTEEIEVLKSHILAMYTTSFNDSEMRRTSRSEHAECRGDFPASAQYTRSRSSAVGLLNTRSCKCHSFKMLVSQSKLGSWEGCNLAGMGGNPTDSSRSSLSPPSIISSVANG
mmetsp:Transcript_46131/g.111789  ORF Transcript_46131/g.111789 Transcript_46131/m.111789 type:complete len:220 (+) Transcript_46131:800-1459(+)